MEMKKSSKRRKKKNQEKFKENFESKWGGGVK